MIVTIEKSLYDRLKEEAEKRETSVSAVLRQLLLNYFGIEDDTKSYRKGNVKNVVIKVGDKEYVRLQVHMKKENELIIKNELKRRGMSVNQLLKNEILLTA
ncbi:lipothrixviral transcriptional regulator AvtR [Sulfolobus islandicus filamentous virus 2]|uniref:Lipothrixviral transcriptional regulator AvtR n=1 Tax=Sulfolobus islandicus filamentous virus 2 TaxID=1902331 RepID=A0A1D8BJ84_SIFV|nr:lipothrixviral transcriptional regulator AvtR [Sulfolobus islandicus filamentous virus 2]